MTPATTVRAACLAAALMAPAATAFAADQPAPFADGDATLGKVLVERDCVACHARRLGDPDKMYLRPDRRVNSPQQLLAQVSFCNTELGSGYFPDDEANVSAYLNRRYYHFKP